MSGFIAVHVGAGYHAENLRPSYKKTCKEACSAAMKLLQDGCNSIEAIAEAVAVLEDSPFTNAGIGSNLTLTGTVECDAGIMEGAGFNYGSVGALSNIKNPIKVAKKLLEEQKKGLLTCGRVPPCTLVGQGAQDWALKHGFDFINGEKLSTRASERAYIKNLHLVQNCTSPTAKPLKFSPDTFKKVDENALLDTVGAVCVDASGNVSSAVSSGGLLLKHPGRIGQAAIYGSGCWAQNSIESDKPSIACSVTGVGEYLVKTLFAKECSQTMYRNYNCISALPDVFRESFFESPYLRDIPSKLAGVLTVKHYASENFCELAWAHNTKTMILGYRSSAKRKPVLIVSEQPEGAVYGKSIVGSEKCVRLDS